MNKFLSKTFPVVNGCDVRRLMYITALVESDMRINVKSRYAYGIMQIEKETMNGVLNDTRMKNTINMLEKKYNVNLSLYKKDIMSNIVAGYAVYIWKKLDHPDWTDRFKYRAGNINDKEWVKYKVNFNSLIGKSKYRRWRIKEKEYKKLTGEKYEIK
ncbi:MAG: hypothetical protein ACRC7W_02830, partial [Fusobacteriaceae bacterium]